MNNRRQPWEQKAVDETLLTPDFLAACGHQPLLAKLLLLRGYTTPQAVKDFLNIDNYTPYNPLDFPDMMKATERVQYAIAQQQAILVYGDFDVDGVTGTTIVYETLKRLGANVTYYMPSRHNEGHGLNTAALIRLISSRKVKVVITTDTGTSNFNEVNLLNGLGVDTIITDHHELPEHLPKAFALLNPMLLPANHPAHGYSGAGMAFLFSSALLQVNGQTNECIQDLYAIGTIVDMVPLTLDNRYWVHQGLKQIAKRERVGLVALMESAGVAPDAPISHTTIGFSIGPRINAVGRLGLADDALNLLVETDKEKARTLAAHIEQLNRKRQDMVETTYREALQLLHHQGAISDQKVLLVASDNWNQGIVGLVATRLAEAFSRPAMVGCVDSESGLVKFSARSVPNVHLTHLLGVFENYFANWGGHAGAAGFAVSVEKAQRFKRDFLDYCNKTITAEDLLVPVQIDLELEQPQLTTALFDIMEPLKPFGVGNPEPVFMLKNATITQQRFLGEAKRHLRLMLSQQQGMRSVEAVLWGIDKPGEELPATKPVDVAFQVEANTFNGQTRLQLVVKSIRISGQLNSTTWDDADDSPIALKLPESAVEKLPETRLPFKLCDLRRSPQVEPALIELIEQPEAVIFAEGLQHYIPIPFPEHRKIGRSQIANLSAMGQGTLLLWDLPTDMNAFVQLVQHLNPKEVHLSGGRYNYVPLVDDPLTYLKGMRNLLMKLCREADHQAVETTVLGLAQTMSTTESLVLAGLTLFNALGVLQVQVLPQQSVRFALTENSPLMSQQDIMARLEYQTFVSMFEESISFRRWWLDSELSVIQSALESALLAVPALR